jgi:hypothetical protein
MRPPRRMTRWTRDGRLCPPACAGGPRRRARRPSSQRAIAAGSSAEEPDPDILKAAPGRCEFGVGDIARASRDEVEPTPTGEVKEKTK